MENRRDSGDSPVRDSTVCGAGDIRGGDRQFAEHPREGQHGLQGDRQREKRRNRHDPWDFRQLVQDQEWQQNRLCSQKVRQERRILLRQQFFRKEFFQQEQLQQELFLLLRRYLQARGQGVSG